MSKVDSIMEAAKKGSLNSNDQMKKAMSNAVAKCTNNVSFSDMNSEDDEEEKKKKKKKSSKNIKEMTEEEFWECSDYINQQYQECTSIEGKAELMKLMVEMTNQAKSKSDDEEEDKEDSND